MSVLSRGSRAGRLTALCLVGLALVLTGCGVANTVDESSGDAPASDESITLESAAGPVELDGPAVRVAVMQWQFVEDLLALGVQPVMIADEQYPGGTNPIPTQLEGRLGEYESLGSRTAPNLEVLASEPLDLIIADKTEHLQNFEQFSQLAPTLILDTNEWANFYPNLQTIAKAVGKEAEGEELGQQLEDTFAAATEEFGASVDGPVLVGVPNPTQFYAMTGGSIQAGVMKELGLDYAYEEVPGTLAEQIPLETLNSLEPAAIFIAVDPKDDVLVTRKWPGNALWDSLPAAQDGHVLEVDRSSWSVGRGVISVEIMIEETLAALTQG